MSNKLDINFIKSEFEKEGYTLLTTEYINSRQKLYYICPRGHRHYIIWKGWKTTGHRCAVCSGRYKYNIDFIKSEFEKENYTLLTTEYKNNKQRLNYICPNGHNHSITWRDWIQGCRCKQCCLDKRRVPLDLIRSEFEKEGCILLTTVYKNNLQKLDYICKNGHKHSIKWNDWNDGHRCKLCGIESSAEKQKLSLDFIKSEFEKEGYQLLTVEYKNAFQKLDYICHNGHSHSIKWNDWQSGYRCPHCAGVAKPTIDFIKSAFAKENYQLLTTEYKNSNQKLDYICSNGHQHSIIWIHWKRGIRCPYCSGKAKPTIDFIKSAFAKENYQLLTTEYKNNKQKLDYVCSNWHQHSIKWNDWRQDCRCPTCANISFSGPGNPNWKGGISFEPYCSVWKDAEYKSDIRDRDGNVCLNPYCDSKNINDLTIHHIDYNKKNCTPQNLITVCRSCNSRANVDRKWHIVWYRTILSKRYGYKYY